MDSRVSFLEHDKQMIAAVIRPQEIDPVPPPKQ